MVETSDVVIAGGGVAGCAVAYYLAKAGVRPNHRRARGGRHPGLRVLLRRAQPPAGGRHPRAASAAGDGVLPYAPEDVGRPSERVGHRVRSEDRLHRAGGLRRLGDSRARGDPRHIPGRRRVLGPLDERRRRARSGLPNISGRGARALHLRQHRSRQLPVHPRPLQGRGEAGHHGPPGSRARAQDGEGARDGHTPGGRGGRLRRSRAGHRPVVPPGGRVAGSPAARRAPEGRDTADGAARRPA